MIPNKTSAVRVRCIWVALAATCALAASAAAQDQARPAAPTDEGGLSVPARVIPLPKTVSAEARRALSRSYPGAAVLPPEDDAEGWREMRKHMRAAMEQHGAQVRKTFPGTINDIVLGGVKAYELVPDDIPQRNSKRAVMYLHGGAYVAGGDFAAASAALSLATEGRYRVYSVDYRLAPEQPYPAALDDAVAAYRAVIGKHAPRSVAVVGLSAGGGLAAATILKARELGLPLPGAAVLLTPEADLTESGDTFQTHQYIDVVLKGSLSQTLTLYAAGHDLKDPYLSPVYGDFTAGFPPTFLQSGTRDLFLSNTVILHRALLRANVEAELHVFEAMPHAGFFGAPEDAEVLAAQLRFMDERLALQ